MKFLGLRNDLVVNGSSDPWASSSTDPVAENFWSLCASYNGLNQTRRRMTPLDEAYRGFSPIIPWYHVSRTDMKIFPIFTRLRYLQNLDWMRCMCMIRQFNITHSSSLRNSKSWLQNISAIFFLFFFPKQYLLVSMKWNGIQLSVRFFVS